MPPLAEVGRVVEAGAAQAVVQRGAERPRRPGLHGVERRVGVRHVEAAARTGRRRRRGWRPRPRRRPARPAVPRTSTHGPDAGVVRPGQHHPHARRAQPLLDALRHVEGEGVLGVAGVGRGARRVAGLGAAAPVGHLAVDRGRVRRRCPRCGRDRGRPRGTRATGPCAAEVAPRRRTGSSAGPADRGGRDRATPTVGAIVADPALPGPAAGGAAPEHAASTRRPAATSAKIVHRDGATATGMRAPRAGVRWAHELVGLRPRVRTGPPLHGYSGDWSRCGRPVG